MSAHFVIAAGEEHVLSLSDTIDAVTLDGAGLDSLITRLQERGHATFGPQVHNGVIDHDVLRSADDLPSGWTDEQSGGRYRLVPRGDGARFGYAVGPKSWKEFLHPARTKVWEMSKETEPGATTVGIRVRMHEPEVPKRAFIGVRPCELAAIAKQDRVLLDGPHPDPTYGANRADLFIVAVNCGDPAETCFCTSMGTGPSAGPGYDLALTELVDGRRRSLRGRDRVGRRRSGPRRTHLDHDLGRRGRRRRSVSSTRQRTGSRATSTPTASRSCSTRTSTAHGGTKSPSAASPAGTAHSPARPVSARTSRTSPI